MNFKDSSQSKNELGEHILFGAIQVYTLQPLPDDVNLSAVLKNIEEKIPKMFFHNIDSIYIGHFKEFDENDTNAFYSDGALFITNDQDNDADLLDDIIHETAHAVELEYEGYIYDLDLEREFLAKRKRLYDRLSTGRDGNPFTSSLASLINKEDFFRLEYNKDFDDLLYQDLGYDFLHNVSYDLFVSPYAITSLQEYWANGFENYFIGDSKDVKSISPVLYNKIETLHQEF